MKNIELLITQIGFIVFYWGFRILFKIGKEILLTFIGEFFDVITVLDNDKLAWLAVRCCRGKAGILNDLFDD
ncbi:MAG: hypothetical protein A2V87_02405 [Deltaproteobacteria bacterium RBG_16_58_17]|nr:MAG: hypothetical protein A2V87_02405 [Deltaproteobacteria bacterium RBG_16_58_17]OHE20474.1 MAG: hypothetical protein A2X95_09830 [Syntrophobacterales bacterium GWF2_56_9]